MDVGTDGRSGQVALRLQPFQPQKVVGEVTLDQPHSIMNLLNERYVSCGHTDCGRHHQCKWSQLSTGNPLRNSRSSQQAISVQAFKTAFHCRAC